MYLVSKYIVLSSKYYIVSRSVDVPCWRGVVRELTMALVGAAAGQVQLGDDDDREARRAAVLRDMETRFARIVLSGYYVL